MKDLNEDPIFLILVPLSLLFFSIFLLQNVLTEKKSLEVPAAWDNEEQEQEQANQELESSHGSVQGEEEESATEIQEEEQISKQHRFGSTTGNENDEDSDDTAVSHAAADLFLQTKLDIESFQDHSLETLNGQGQIDISADNVMDHLPPLLSQPLVFVEKFFDKSTDLTAKGISMTIKPFEKAFGLHVHPAYESSKSFVLKQKSSIVDIIKKRALRT